MEDIIEKQIYELNEKLKFLEEKREYLDSVGLSFFKVSSEIDDCNIKISGLKKLLLKKTENCNILQTVDKDTLTNKFVNCSFLCI